MPEPDIAPEEQAFSSPAARSMRRFGARWIALLAATVIALYLCWRMIDPFIEVLLWAGVLVIIFYPVHTEIVDRVKGANLAAALSCILVAVTILAPLTLVTLAVAREAVAAADNVEKGVNKLLDPDSLVHHYVGRWVDLSDLKGGEWKASAVQWVQDRGGAIAGQTFLIAGKVLGTVIKIFFVIFTMYYFFRDAERIKAALHNVLPLEWEQSEQIFEHTKEVITASVNGVIVIAAIQGTLGGFAFWVLGIPSPLIWAVVMFLTSMIPLGGSAIVWVPAALFLLFQGHWIRAIELTLWGALVIGMLDNILRPRLVGNRTRMHELLVFFSVLGGLQVFGVLGLVVGPVVVAITLALLDVFRQVQRPAAVTLKEPSVIEDQAALRDVPAEPPQPPVEQEQKKPQPLPPQGATVEGAAGGTEPA